MIQVKIAYVDLNKGEETIMEVETFENAKKYTDKAIQKWVSQKSIEYESKYNLNEQHNNDEDENYYYEFQYYKWDKRPYHLGDWMNIQNQSILDTLNNK